MLRINLNDDDLRRFMEDVPQIQQQPILLDGEQATQQQYRYAKYTIHQMSMLFYQSCEDGNLDIVQHIITHHGTTNKYSVTCNSRIMLPVNINNVNHKHNNRTPLHAACIKNHANIVNFLLDQEGIESCPLDESKKTPLHLCCEAGSEEAALALLHHKNSNLDVNARDVNGVSPIYTSVMNHRWSLANHLLLAGADVNLKKSDGMTLLHACMVSGDVDVLTYLVELPEKHHLMLNARDEFGDTPLFKAVSHSGRTKAIRLLLSSGNNSVGTWIRNNAGENIFHLLCKTGNVNLLYFLIDILPMYSSNVSNPNSSASSPATPLQQLETHIRSSCAEEEASSNDFEPLSPMGVLLTPTGPPTPNPHGFMSRFINSRKSAANTADSQQVTCVEPKIQQLLNEKDKSGFTPLHVAVKFDQADLVKALLSLKSREQTVLSEAEMKLEKRKSFRKSLVHGGTTSGKLYDAIQINQIDSKLNTALHLAIAAVESGKARSGPQIIKALMSVKNVRTDIKNNAGETAKNYAKRCNVSLK